MINLLFVCLYIVSFAAGIGLMTLIYYFYSKSKSPVAKLILTGDILFTLILLLDTLDLYFRKNAPDFPVDLHGFNLVPSLAAGIVGLYLLTLVCHHITGMRMPDKIWRPVFAAAILVWLINVFCRIPHLVPAAAVEISENAAYVSVDLIMLFNVGLVLTRLKQTRKDLRPIALSCAALVPVFVLYNLATSLFHQLPDTFYKVPVSPLVYVYMNLMGILFVRKNMFSGHEAVETFDYEQFASAYGITHRELEIVRMIAEGFNNREISRDLSISPATVKNYIYSIYRKTAVKNRLEFMNLLYKTE